MTNTQPFAIKGSDETTVCSGHNSYLLLLFSFLLFLTTASTVQAQTRNFQMALWNNELQSGLADADIRFFFELDLQFSAPTHAVLDFFPFNNPPLWDADPVKHWNAMVSQTHYDFSRIDAVVVDEPYLHALTAAGLTSVGPNPCHDSDPARYNKVLAAYQQLQGLAQAVRNTSHSTRLWVNFSVPEIQWMMDTTCPQGPLVLNNPFFDVVSLDQYNTDFVTTVQLNYDWLVAHRASGSQQIALVPGTFVSTDRSGNITSSTPSQQAAFLPAFFNYADVMNQSCNLPLGTTGVTGRFDGCLVWLVIGFNGDNFTESDGTLWHGEFDQLSAPIHSVWVSELALQIRDPIIGKIETMTTAPGPNQGVITGWAMDRNFPGTPTDLDFWIDGSYAGSALASASRPDIAREFGSGVAAFTFKIPNQYLNGQDHHIDAYAIAISPAQAHGAILLNSSTANTFSSIQSNAPLAGRVESITVGASQGVIQGWALNQNALGAAANLDFWIDGQYAGSTSANGNRLDIAQIFGSSTAGFTFQIPAQFLDGVNHLVNVFIVCPNIPALLLNPTTLNSFPFELNNFSAGLNNFPLVGQIESIVTTPGLAQGMIQGWALNQNALGNPVNLDFWIDGQYAGSTSANGNRSDIAQVFGNGTAGFSFKIPAQYLDGADHHVDAFIVIPNLPALLLNSSTLNSFPLAGRVESIVSGSNPARGFVNGWVDNFNYPPGASVFVDFLIDNILVGTVYSSGNRPDIGQIYGNNAVGFTFEIPARYLDGANHHIDVKAYLPLGPSVFLNQNGNNTFAIH